MHYLQLIRVKNLAIIAFTLILMRYAVIHPVYESNGAHGAMGAVWFWLFVLHAVLIAAGGNVINDYFDTHIDHINKPDKVIVGTKVPRKKAMGLHNLLTGIGAFIGLIIAYRIKSVPIAFLLLFIPGLLWFYSSVYKRHFLVGNLIIALLCALVPITLVMIENRFLFLLDGEAVVRSAILKWAYITTGMFGIFAFLTTLIREIVKDVEDEEGDRELECSTVPIVLGKRWTKVILILLSVVTILLVGFVYWGFISNFDDSLSYNYLLLLVVVPMVVVIVLTYLAKRISDFSRISSLLKYIMLTGTLYAIVFYFMLAQNFDISFFNLNVQ